MGNGEKHILGFTDFFDNKELYPAFDFIFPPELNNIYFSQMVVVSHMPTYVHMVCLSEQGVAISIHISNQTSQWSIQLQQLIYAGRVLNGGYECGPVLSARLSKRGQLDIVG